MANKQARGKKERVFWGLTLALFSALVVGGAVACAAAEATATPVPTKAAVAATATAVPPTATKVPPTATKVPPTPTPREVKKASVALDWFAAGHHAHYYVALEKGFYKDEALEVDILSQPASGKEGQLLDAGAITFAGMTSGEALIRARVAGIKIKMVGALFPLESNAILGREDKGIKSPKDLEGKTIASEVGAVSDALFPAYCKAAGIDCGKVKKIGMDPAGKVGAAISGKVDGYLSVTYAAPYFDEVGGAYVLPYRDVGINTFSYGIAASEKLMNSDPDLIRRFVRATLKGLQYAIDHPEEGAEIVGKFQEKPVVDLNLKVWKVKVPGELYTENTKDKPLGWMSEQDWKDTVDTLTQWGVLEEDIDPEDLFTNEFLP